MTPPLGQVLARQRFRFARAQSMRILKSIATEGRAPITYTELVDQLVGVNLLPQSDQLSRLLCDISRTENARVGVMLSALVVHESDDLPGDGFFDLAVELGRPAGEKRDVHNAELEAIRVTYGPK